MVNILIKQNLHPLSACIFMDIQIQQQKQSKKYKRKTVYCNEYHVNSQKRQHIITYKMFVKSLNIVILDGILSSYMDKCDYF